MNNQIDLSAWLALFAMMSLAGLARWRDGAWWRPAPFLATLWTLAMTPAFLARAGGINGLSTWICVLLVAAFVAGAGCIKSSGKQVSLVNSPEWQCQTTALEAIAICFSICGFAALYYYIQQGPGFGSLLSLDAWLESAVRYSVARYEGDETEPLAIRVLMGFNYAAAMLGGAAFSLKCPRASATIAMPLVVGACITLITTAKAPFMICIMAAICGAFAARSEGTDAKDSERKLGVREVAIAIAIALVLVLSLAARYGGGDDVDSELITGRVAGYLFGQVYAFSAWVTTGGWLIDNPGLGKYSLAGVFELLGAGARAGGMYTEIAIDDGAAESNVFTAFRGLVQDFYLTGAVAIMFLAGLLAKWLTQGRSVLLPRPLAIASLLVAYLFIGWSPIISIFNYNSMVMAVGAATLALMASFSHRGLKK